MPVALRQPRVGALVGPGADYRGQFGLDQRLIDRRRCCSDPFLDIGALEHFEQLEQERLIQGHRVESFRENHWRGLADHHTVAPLT